jgi:hypothetical protein
MLRRQARERREFIYRKTVEQRQKAIEEKKERLKHALEGTLTALSIIFFSNLLNKKTHTKK